MSVTAHFIRPGFQVPDWSGPRPDGLDGKALVKLRQSAMIVTVAADEELFDQDSPAGYCYQLVSGCLRTVRLMEDGRRLIERFLLPGDLLGFEDAHRHDVAAQAVCPAVLDRFPLQAITSLAERDAEFARFLWGAATAELRAGRVHGFLLGRKTATERVASFLFDLDTRMSAKAPAVIPLPMGRSDIADYLGLTVETISRTLTQLQLAGVISVRPGAIGIRNAAALAALAAEPVAAIGVGNRPNATRH